MHINPEKKESTTCLIQILISCTAMEHTKLMEHAKLEAPNFRLRKYK